MRRSTRRDQPRDSEESAEDYNGVGPQSGEYDTAMTPESPHFGSIRTEHHNKLGALLEILVIWLWDVYNNSELSMATYSDKF
ncbi:hypothetical protein SERLA73DRAFT_75928 [Serpula lacrymans var. lacrymans S7.3]|uniref:Uncharacterized protein n=1 Tax=Serpula lacrymans var. lacrymans (strain S7.3) TaxID=936435 RepID=F8Q5N6_SERL3|nr:hypothetical protein SERLA73DRAFT_75928 [Serpula lacrymans var. lacrymans S7.3]